MATVQQEKSICIGFFEHGLYGSGWHGVGGILSVSVLLQSGGCKHRLTYTNNKEILLDCKALLACLP